MKRGVSIIILRTLPVFHGLADETLARVAGAASLRGVARGEVVMNAGDRADNVYFILSGDFRVLVGDDEGREVILSVMRFGDFFGEMGVIDDYSRSATVQAVHPGELVVIAKSDFRSILVDSSDISLQIMRSLVSRLRTASRKIESLALLDVYGRVARLLLDLSEKTSDGIWVVSQPPSKQDIAKMIGASREMVSRVMKELQEQGLIHEGGGRLIILDDCGAKRFEFD